MREATLLLLPDCTVDSAFSSARDSVCWLAVSHVPTSQIRQVIFGRF